MEDTQAKDLDIVLPCYNPASGWAANIIAQYHELRQKMPALRLHFFVVNDGSLRGCNSEDIELLQQELPSFQFIEYRPNQGKGYALRQGVAQTKSDFCIYTDIDFPYTLTSFLDVYQQLCQGADVVVGLRSGNYYAQAPLLRRWISKILRFLIRFCLRMPITDTQGGLKGFSARGRQVFLRTTIHRYLFDLEFIFLSSREKGLKLQGTEVELRPGIVFSRMNWRILLQESWSFVKLFWKSLF